MKSISYEIVAMVHKDYGQKVIDTMHNDNGIESIIVAYGRSSDLFEDKQFGEFGEAAYITILTNEEYKEAIFSKLFDICDLKTKHTGIIFTLPRSNHNIKIPS